MMRRASLFCTLLLALLVLVPAQAPAQHHHHRFDDPAKWSKAFDDPERDAWQKPDEVIKALGLAPAARVADIGAGTGYFTVRLARALPGGSVTAVDIEPKMVAHIAERAKALGLANVRAVEGSADAPNLPEPVDVALLVNVYHHIEARPAYMHALAASLRPGGRVVIIEQRPDAPRGPPRHVRLAVSAIDAEMTAAGYVRAAAHEFLPHQNFLVYQPAARR